MKTRTVLAVSLCFHLTASLVVGQRLIRIVSEPSGAKIEINGQYFLGTTPFLWKVEDWMTNPRKSFAFSKHLNEPITLSFSKEGFVRKELLITTPPQQWTNLYGQPGYVYYVIKPEIVQVGKIETRLEKIDQFLGSNPYKTTGQLPTTPPTTASRSRLTTEEVVQRALPAVVTVRSDSGTGTGFVITDTGIVVTNKHVVGNSERVSVLTSRGESLVSASIFMSPTRDLALIKLQDGSRVSFLPLADPAKINVGAEVIAIGSPAGALHNTVTRGVVSSFRKTDDQGVLIQTDVAMNAGNSGGPLLDTDCEVIGVNTLKIAALGVDGLNFAISSGEILQMLKDHFDYVPGQGRSAKDSIAGTDVAPLISNGDVVELTKAGLAPEVISAKIRNSPSNFDTSVKALQELKSSGIPDSVILAMVEAPVVHRTPIIAKAPEIVGSPADSAKPVIPTSTEAARTPETPVPKAIVHFYRGGFNESSARTKAIYVDQVMVARSIDKGRFFTINVAPGKRFFYVSPQGKPPLELDIRAGETYFLKIDMGMTGTRVFLVDREKGGREITKTKPEEGEYVITITPDGQ